MSFDDKDNFLLLLPLLHGHYRLLLLHLQHHYHQHTIMIPLEFQMTVILGFYLTTLSQAL